MVGMDSWCPSCGYSVEPGTRFCSGCGRQFAAGDGGSAAQSSAVTMLSPGAPFPGYAAPPPPANPLSAPVTATPHPPVGSPVPSAPPTIRTPLATLRPVPPPPPAPGQAPMWGTMEPMPRSQDSFDHRMSPPADWQQAGPPVPGAYPSDGQDPSTSASQPPEPPQPWPDAPAPALPPTALDQYSQGDAYPGPYDNGQGQFPPGQFWPGIQSGSGGQGLLGKLSFNPSPVVVAVAVTVAVGIILVVVGAHALS
jgi:hypothetical protein